MSVDALTALDPARRRATWALGWTAMSRIAQMAATLLVASFLSFVFLQMAPGDPVFQRVASLGHPDLLVLRRPWDAERKRVRAVIPVEEVPRALPELPEPDEEVRRDQGVRDDGEPAYRDRVEERDHGPRSMRHKT